MRYNFEWDPVKAKQNVRKHKISFQRAATIFSDSRAISIFDDEHSKEEDRWITIGVDSRGILVVVSHNFGSVDDLSSNIRIISARKATKQETKQYEELNI